MSLILVLEFSTQCLPFLYVLEQIHQLMADLSLGVCSDFLDVKSEH